MSFVWPNPQTVKRENIQVAQPFEGRGRNLTQICGVRKVVEAIGDYRQAAVDNFQRRYFQIATKAEAGAIHNRVRNDLRQAAAKVRRLENVLKNAANVFPGALVGIETQGAMAKIQRPDVIESEDMIGMTMRNQHRIEVFQTDPQSLLPKITRGIHDYGLARVLD
jgi:hypothetical protein